MVERFQIFEPRYNDDQLEDEFHNFFYKYNLTPLLTNEHRAGTITVTYTSARSVINEGGSYNTTLKEFSDVLSMANDNKTYEEALFKIIYEARTFQKLIKNIRTIMNYINSLDNDKLFNMWNIVFYNKELL